MSGALAWTIVIPLAGAALTALVGSRAARWTAGAAMAATLASIAITVHGVVVDGPVRVHVGGWAPPLGIGLYADGLAIVMLSMIAVVAGILGGYAIVRGAARPLASRFFSLWLFLWAGLDALVLSSDIFNLYVTLELVTLAAVGLIAIGADRLALRAALRYLLVALPGSLVYLLGVALLYGRYATLDVSLLGARIESTQDGGVGLTLLVVGLVLKAALFPLHGWLPSVYASARPVVSAVLAGLVGKAAFVVVARLWWHLNPLAIVAAMGPVLAALGAGAILWGALLALQQSRLKLVIAYSSVAHVGYLFIAFGIRAPDAWQGAVYVAVSHAVAVAALFVACGTLEDAFGDDHIDNVKGLSERFPLAFFAIALAGVSVMGMPPTGGFIGKWLLVRAALASGQLALAAVLIVGGLLSAGYMFRVVRRAFLPAPRQPTVRPVSLAGELVALALASLGVVLGLAPWLVLEGLAIGGGR